MNKGKSSFSAEVVATMRAIEANKPDGDRICYDPFAKFFLRKSFRFLAESKIVSPLLLNYVEKKGPGFPGGIVVRTKYIDDLLKKCLHEDCKQVVILGAGFDTRAFRIERKSGTKIFEVDFPDTQAYKLSKLKQIPQLNTEGITYVPIDFNSQKIADKLKEAGYNPILKTFFIWEGVTMYLTTEAVDETLSFISQNTGKGSSIYFDYMLGSVLDGSSQYEEAIAIRKTGSFNANGEELYTFSIPDGTIHEFLKQREFKLLEEQNGESLKEKYFKQQYPKRKVHRLFGYVHAEINDMNTL